MRVVKDQIQDDIWEEQKLDWRLDMREREDRVCISSLLLEKLDVSVPFFKMEKMRRKGDFYFTRV